MRPDAHMQDSRARLIGRGAERAHGLWISGAFAKRESSFGLLVIPHEAAFF